MSEVRNVIIIGSGPAGHTAAIYAGRALLEPLLFEGYLAGGIAAGGQLTTTTDVENYPGFPDGILGPDLMEKMRQQSINSGCEILTKTIDRVDFSGHPYKVYAGDDEYRAKTVLICTGATAKRLHISGEDVYWQKGVSACAVCDGALPIFRDKHLYVVGGGDAACEEATFLTKYGSQVTMLIRRDEMRASQIMQERVQKNDKVNIMRNTEAIEVCGDGEQMTGVKVVNNQTDEKQELEGGGLFYAIGHKPNVDFLDGQVDLDDAGYIKTAPGTTKTNVDGVFAAGDVQDKKYRQAVTSAGTGCMAALDAEHWIQTHE